jgi:hypothetical protein
MDNRQALEITQKLIEETSTTISDMLKDMPYCVYDEIMRQVERKVTGVYRLRG